MLQIQHNENETILHCSLSDIFDTLPSDVQCVYDKQTKHLRLKSQFSIPACFFTDIVSYVYGKNAEPLRNSPSCNILNSTSFSMTEELQNVYVSSFRVSLKKWDYYEKKKFFEEK